VPGLSDNLRVRSILGRFSSTVGSSGSPMTGRRRSGSVPQTSCTATSTAGSRCIGVDHQSAHIVRDCELFDIAL
jgi:hypothetical protein